MQNSAFNDNLTVCQGIGLTSKTEYRDLYRVIFSVAGFLFNATIARGEKSHHEDEKSEKFIVHKVNDLKFGGKDGNFF
jgi:hypothetical protein